MLSTFSAFMGHVHLLCLKNEVLVKSIAQTTGSIFTCWLAVVRHSGHWVLCQMHVSQNSFPILCLALSLSFMSFDEQKCLTLMKSYFSIFSFVASVLCLGWHHLWLPHGHEGFLLEASLSSFSHLGPWSIWKWFLYAAWGGRPGGRAVFSCCPPCRRCVAMGPLL